jgi:hypothetical protein
VRAIRILFNLVAHAAHQFRLWAALRVARMATPAGTESGVLGGFRLHKQNDIPGLRAPRWARRPAINSGRTHSVNECAVHPRVMPHYRSEIFLARGLRQSGR